MTDWLYIWAVILIISGIVMLILGFIVGLIYPSTLLGYVMFGLAGFGAIILIVSLFLFFVDYEEEKEVLPKVLPVQNNYLPQSYEPTLTQIYSTPPEYQYIRQAEIKEEMWSNPPQINIPVINRPDLANIKIGNPYQPTAQMVESVNREVIMGPKFEMVKEVDSESFRVINNPQMLNNPPVVNVKPLGLNSSNIINNPPIVNVNPINAVPQDQLRSSNVRTNNRVKYTVNQDQLTPNL